MATNRSKRMRKFQLPPISPKLRAFLETGRLSDGNNPANTSEDGDIFILACSYRKTAEAYGPYRQEILADWKKRKCTGEPYAEQFFINPGV